MKKRNQTQGDVSDGNSELTKGNEVLTKGNKVIEKFKETYFNYITHQNLFMKLPLTHRIIFSSANSIQI